MNVIRWVLSAKRLQTHCHGPIAVISFTIYVGHVNDMFGRMRTGSGRVFREAVFYSNFLIQAKNQGKVMELAWTGNIIEERPFHQQVYSNSQITDSPITFFSLFLIVGESDICELSKTCAALRYAWLLAPECLRISTNI